jgi:radical SAM enzyme (TIGR01210 family)
MSTISKDLREGYYKNHKVEICMDISAFGGSITESIGPWPEFNLRGIKCNRSIRGLCSPCFYSKFAKIYGCNNKKQMESLFFRQIDKLLNKFEDIINDQNGQVKCNVNDLKYKTSTPICICLTPVGSFFDGKEFSPKVRLYMLNALINKSDEYKRDIVLYVESHVEDFLKYDFDNEENHEEISLLHNLHVHVVFGFESRNDFVRNVLYNKSLPIEKFEIAIDKAHRYGFLPYAFVMAGLSPLKNYETISDVEISLRYLKEMDVHPVLMFANVHKYTINDLLIKNGYPVLLEPRTLLEIIRLAVEIFPEDGNLYTDSWLTADPVGGPPKPDNHIFNDSKKITCSACSSKICDLYRIERKQHDSQMFLKELNKINNCSCSKEYNDMLEDEKKKTDKLFERTCSMITYVESQVTEYLSDIEKNDTLDLKANLLCYGIHIKDEKTIDVLSEPPYLIERGFVHSTNILLGDVPVNVCINDTFCLNSPYEVIARGNVINLFYKGEYVRNISLLKLEPWCFDSIDGYKIGEYLRPHSQNCIAMWPNWNCCFSDKCKFCSLKNDKPTLSSETAAKMICHALSYNSKYEVALGGGIFESFEENVKYYSEIAHLVLQNYSVLISLETIPPLSKKEMLIYKESGISSLIMNLEIFDDDLRKNICPCKFTITKDRYFEAFKEAVEIFGKGQVSSVLLVGIQPTEDLIQAASRMTKLGVIPVIMPFQPLSNSSMMDYSVTDVDEYLEVSSRVSKMIIDNNLTNFISIGCTKCGACSLEKNLLN